MTTMTDTVATYIAAWNETDPARRRELVDRTFAPDATYVDPLMTGAGADAIDGLIAGAQAQFPGHEFVLVGGPDHHHDRVRFTWELRPIAGGATVAIGHDMATVAADAGCAT